MSMEQYRSRIIPDRLPQGAGGNNTLRRMVLDFIETVVLSLFLFLGINAVTARIRVESISMQPTLYAGDLVLVNKLAYKFGLPDRGDIIIFHYPPDPNREPYIKRVIGIPGDIIRVAEGKILINDEVIAEPYLKVTPNYEGDWVVPEGSLFVLGDNRNRSSDSHSWGMVPLKNVMGRALVVYWPPKDWKALDVTIAIAADH